MDMNELLLQSVETLPPLPDTVIKLRRYIDEAGAEIRTEKVAEIISGDPLLMAKLLQLVNSPFYGFKSEITTITQVITLLGIGNIKNMILANSIKDNFKIDLSPYGLNTQEFLNSCNEEVNFITNWLNEEDKKLSYSLVPCVMLLRLGMVIFSHFLIQNHKDKEFLARLKEMKFTNISMIENEFVGVDSLAFLGFLLHRWNFDESLIESVCFINSPHAASDSVKKSAYALSITDHLFAPYHGSSPFNVEAALALMQEAINSGVSFDLDSFVAKLPERARKNIKKD
ncbi:HDOD domain-containing protein [Campylobacter helveticus]|uniref:HDOD domain-containing protein n=1 Tax=Campylobacter helveticus TaxID=28898 RepID=A0AAX2UKX6_9BACT|nr:HDOD domain-containing protein [Campylobacter helveticus]ARE81358.1 HDOD domain-containing signal-transduction protein [Campylobacter helveticus]MCR2040205.1 HDOD domain-containing protein [Campylobacter helveticus]MCR2054902.1 HDOD domain-containing protein [Campylobacter helveticus]MCR2056768.1 HDOD domain-containing protein [Campylobacter helveticus]MCR2060408.1 HDOD domain-containing protein [Campylobacter helveticus]